MVNAQPVAKVVEEEFGPKFQAAGGKTVFGETYLEMAGGKLEEKLEIIEKQGVLLRFSVPTRHVKRERVISLALESDSVFQINSKPSRFMILRVVQSGHVNCPFFEIGYVVLCSHGII